MGNSNSTPTARTGQGVQPVVAPHGWFGWDLPLPLHSSVVGSTAPLMYSAVPPGNGAEPCCSAIIGQPAACFGGWEGALSATGPSLCFPLAPAASVFLVHHELRSTPPSIVPAFDDTLCFVGHVAGRFIRDWFRPMPLPLTQLFASVILALTLPMISMKLWAKMAPDDMAVEPPPSRQGILKVGRASELGAVGSEEDR